MHDFNDKIKQNAKYIMLQQVIAPVINFLLSIYIIKKLSVVDYGIYNLLYALIGYITLFSSFGLLNVFQRFIPEFNTRKEYSKVKILFKSGFVIRFVLTVLILSILLMLGNFISNLFKAEHFNHYILFFAIGILFFLEIQLVEVTLSSLLLNKLIMLSYLIATVIRACLTFLFLERDMGLKGLLLAETIYFFLLLSLLMFFYYSGFAKKYESLDRNLSIRRLIRYGGFSYFDELGWTILDVKTDFFIISSFLGPASVGLYAFANRIIEIILRMTPFQILKPLIRTVFFSKYSEHGAVNQLQQHFNFLNKVIAFISFPIVMGILIYGDKIIIHLFDTKYLPALHILWIFAGFMTIMSFQFPLQLVAQALEKVEIDLYSKIFSIYNLIGDLLIIQIAGILGVALITGSARAFQLIFVFCRIRKFVALKIDIYPFIKIFANSLLMMGGLYFSRDFIDGAFSLICFSLLGLLLYLIASFLNRSFINEEREIINRFLPRPIFVF